MGCIISIMSVSSDSAMFAIAPMSTAPLTKQSLRAVMRAVPGLAPEDSIGRFVRVSRQCACSSLPIVQRNFLVGVVGSDDVLPLLSQEADTASVLERPLAEVMRAPMALIRPDMSPWDARSLFVQHGLDLMACLPVVDASGYCLGIVSHNDLLVADRAVSRPGSVGGMATPFGVYLTDGTHQAGAGNLALIASGMVTGALLLCAGASINAGVGWLAYYVPLLRGVDTLDTADSNVAVSPALALLNFGVKLLIYLVFFGLLRLSAIAGYHAAEHQTVHALERNESLVANVVRRMPRPHPRCGTNIMAIGLIQFTLSPLLAALLHLDSESAFLLTALVNFMVWRRIGTWLQAVFTTRPATDRQLDSGIRAGRLLLETFYNSPPVRTHPLRRLWCMGVLQNLIGLLLVTGGGAGLTWLLSRLNHH